MSYIYQADIYCDDCGEAICRRIEACGNTPEDITDESSYDSDSFPKYADGSAEADSPQHCGNGEDCINSIAIEDDWHIGAWLENDLTSEGEGYVIEAVRDGRNGSHSPEVTELWAKWYDYIDFTEYYMCDECREDVDVNDLDEDNMCSDCREELNQRDI